MNGIEDEFNNTLGCLFLVGLFSVMLYGITCGQILYYLTHYLPGDHTYITILVVVLCWIVLVAVLKLSDRRKLWPLFMVPAFVLVSGSFAAALVGTVQVQYADNIFGGISNAKLAGTIRPVSAAVVDIYITAWLCYHLHDSKTGHAESDSMVTKLVNYAITRGIVTSASQVAAFVLFLVDYRRKTLWFLILYIPASTLYVNSLFAMWNARRHVMTSSTHPTNAGSLSTWQFNVNTGLEEQQDLP
ncbi:hypothetical protein FOMPIDRAFT_1055495 [Fomitopsis schrenkii]|uniref:DUF6534 domain-containing protein n=1 Tax=Fomitopsis schrenkii TaxID=2126942 RepID=S8EWH9_FOMSC|nr:hypothetical protein FOMPIDRAFT_1055495 [Fomitopsis schrenkii]